MNFLPALEHYFVVQGIVAGCGDHTRQHRRDRYVTSGPAPEHAAKNSEQRQIQHAGRKGGKDILHKLLPQDPVYFDRVGEGVEVCLVVGAKAEIYKLIDELAGEGLSIMFISSELPEIIGLSDRVYVMCNGRITGELNHDELTEEKLLELSMADELAETAKIMNNTENATL